MQTSKNTYNVFYYTISTLDNASGIASIVHLRRIIYIINPMDTSKKAAAFKSAVRHHYRLQGRHDLPWRKTRDPYAILVSEVMLQQTQVSRVEGFYGRFLEKFPDFRTLADARASDVLAAWQGLGYNRRALSLKRLAETVMGEYGGNLPSDRAALERLPGIGKGTSGSLMAFVFNKPELFIETNIRRVFIHHFFPRMRRGVTDEEIERYIQRTMDHAHPREWYWALMDYGATLGRSAQGIGSNPNRRSAHYKKQGTFRGSDRELRGRILRYLLSQKNAKGESAKKGVNKGQLAAFAGISGSVESGRIERVVSRLLEEGFIIKRRNSIYINDR